MNLQDSANKLKTLLGLSIEPVAISFVEKAPEGVERVSSAAPAGCGYWKQAAEGNVFYTEAPDHYNCPVGSHTHGVPLPKEVEAQLGQLMGTMVGLGYLSKEEIPSIPHREEPFRVAVYAPLGKAPCPPDVVLVRGNVRQLMVLAEAAQAAGAAGDSPALGRPTCAVLPLALATDRTAASFGCVGNRVYTGAGDGEAYYAIPGSKLETVVSKLETIANANRELEKFHRSRL